MAGLPVHGIPMDTKRRAGMVTHGTLLLHGHSASVCVWEMGYSRKAFDQIGRTSLLCVWGFSPLKVRSVDVRGQ